MTSEVMDSGSPFSDTAGVAMTAKEGANEKECFQPVVRSVVVVVVLSFNMVGER
jgi:hypothetical protein